ncbi:PilX N-terminal domain-containing pilus assembly protein [Thermodesulfobacteriota bacterium]
MRKPTCNSDDNLRGPSGRRRTKQTQSVMMEMHAKQMIRNEDGSVVFVAIVILILLTLMGLSATTTSTIEVQIAANEYLHKEALYFADGSTEVGIELLEQNLACPIGFKSDNLHDEFSNNLEVIDKDFWIQSGPPDYFPVGAPDGEFTKDDIGDDDDDPSNDGSRDIRVPRDDSQPHSNLTFYGNTVMSTGSSIMMAAGYEGKGKGSAGGGAYLLFNVYTRHFGKKGSEILLMNLWRHVIGMEGDCKY